MRYKLPPKPALDYNGLIRGTLAIVWRHRYLWLLGLFAGGSTSLGGWSCNYQDYTTGDQGAQTALTRAGNTASDWIGAHLALFVTILAAAVLVGLALFLFSILCQGSIIAAARELLEGREAGLGRAMSLGRAVYGRMLVFHLLLLAAGFGFFIVLAGVIFLLVLLAASGPGGAAAAAVLFALLFGWLALGLLAGGWLSIIGLPLAAGIFVTLLVLFALRFIVIEGARPLAAIASSFRFVRDNLARVLLIFLLSAGLSIGGFIVIGFAAIITGLIALIAWFAVAAAGFPAYGIVIAIVFSLPLPAAAIVLLAGVNGYLNCFWTNALLKLREVEGK